MSHISKWKITESEYVVNDRWIKVRADRCELDNGVIIEPYYVLQYPTWVNTFALTPDEEVVLVRQYRHGIGRIVLELPSGTVEQSDDSIEKAARRELMEETGYGGGTFMETGCLSPNTANHLNMVHCFLAKDVELITNPQEDDYEQIETVVKPLPEVIEMVRTNKFHQELHTSAVFWALDKLNRLDIHA